MLEVGKENFEVEVLQASGKVLVDFYGESCEPCQAIMPFVYKMAEQYGDKLKFIKLDTGKARRLAISQKVMGLPVIAIYENGAKVAELVKEECTETAIEELIKAHV